MPIEEVPFPSAGKWHPLSMTAGLQRVIKFQMGNMPMIYFYQARSEKIKYMSPLRFQVYRRIISTVGLTLCFQSVIRIFNHPVCSHVGLWTSYTHGIRIQLELKQKLLEKSRSHSLLMKKCAGNCMYALLNSVRKLR